MPSFDFTLRQRGEATPDRPVIVASAQAINVATFEEAQSLTLTRQPWQARAWGYFDEVGEIHFPARYVGNALAKIRLVGAERPESFADAPVLTKNESVNDAVGKLKSPTGGQGGLLRSMGLNLFVVGECFLLGSDDGKVQSWEAVSVNEIEIRPGEKVAYRRRNPAEQPKPLKEGTLVVRVWSAHPRYSGLADGAIRTVLDECEKLLLLTRADKAAARSRFAGAGLLFIPNELMPVVQQPAGTSGVDAAENPIYQNLIESMITPIKDEQHPSGVVPITIFGPGEYGDKIRFITFDRPQAARAQQQREESITRIATALDLPAEILTGKADLNHWSAWQVREETFQQHFQPMVELICDALTTGYLLPALKRAKVPDPEKYLIWYDDTELVVRPDKGQTAAQLFAENAISAKAYRRETGFAEEDAMGDAEYAKKVGLVLQDEQLALTGKPGTAPPGMAPPAPPVAPGGGATPSVGGDSPTLKDKLTAPKDTTPNKAQTQGIPNTPKPQDGLPYPVKVTASAARAKRKRPLGMQLAQLDIGLMMQLRVAASEVLSRELERAGARIRSKTQNSPEYKDLLRDVPNPLVASVLGPSVVASLDLTDTEVMKGAFSTFGSRAAALLAAAQVERNRLIARKLAEVQNREDDEAIAEFEALYGQKDKDNRDRGLAIMLGGLTALALTKLYDPSPESVAPGQGEFDTLLVPADIIRDAVEAAGGSGPDDAGGVGTGGTTRDIFADQGVGVTGQVWVYGNAIRTPFDAHDRLDGQPFSSWDDEVLAVEAGDEWIETDDEHPGYHPGDHRGCLCAVAPITNIDDATDEVDSG